VVVGDALIGHRFQDVLQRVVCADGDRLTIAVFPALVCECVEEEFCELRLL